MAQISSLVLARFLRLPRRSGDKWQGGLLRMPMWIDGPDGTPYRPWGGVWVSGETGLVNVKVAETGDAALAVESLLELGLKFAQSRPAGIEVVDRALGDEIAGALGDPALSVTVVPDLQQVKAMLRQMAARTGGERVPAALDGRGVTVEGMRAFAVAARDFHAAAPWRLLSDEDLIHVESPRVGEGFRHLVVLGRAGQVYGLGFFSSERDFERLLASGGPMGSGRSSVIFGPAWAIPFADLELWEEHDLPLAGPEAYPLATWFGGSGRMRRPDARELADIETILLALSRSGESDIDRGRWSQEVSAHDGPRQVTLAIPELLGPLEAPADPARQGNPDRRAMERAGRLGPEARR